MAKGDDIEERLIDFAVRLIRVCDSLQDSPSATHIRGQLIRSGTAPAAHYAEARGAESGKDFAHKLKLALKELNESRIWLKMLARAELVEPARLANLLDECDQLCRILSASIHTSRKKTRR